MFTPSGSSVAQYGQPEGTNPSVAQPLVREGDLAVRLMEALGLGTPLDEATAESALSAVGISPRNGWMADYPLTPDIIGEVQTSISDAADSGTLNIGKDTALTAFQGIINEYDLSVAPALEGQGQAGAAGSDYPEQTIINNYYDVQGPPVVTYYSPPPAYAYLYTWVPYPFWYTDVWFPGFFVLVDFDVRPRIHEHEHRRGHFTNHFRNPRTGRISRIDPTNRFHDGQRIVPRGTRGYHEPMLGGATPSDRDRPSAFDRYGTSRFEGRASDRGFRSRSQAGQIPDGRTIGQPGGKKPGEAGAVEMRPADKDRAGGISRSRPEPGQAPGGRVTGQTGDRRKPGDRGAVEMRPADKDRAGGISRSRPEPGQAPGGTMTGSETGEKKPADRGAVERKPADRDRSERGSGGRQGWRFNGSRGH